MNILILYSTLLPSELRFAEFLKQRGCYVLMRQFTVDNLNGFDDLKVAAVINRVYSRDVAKNARLYPFLIRQIIKFEKRNIRTINGHTATLCDLNKYILFKQLHAAGINTPTSYLFHSMEQVRELTETLPQGAYVIKPSCGGCGEHVSRALDKNSLLSLAEEKLISAHRRNYQLGFILQPFIESARDIHYRVQMVAEQYICCHSRSLAVCGDGNPWIASASLGSHIKYLANHELPDDMLAVCRRAAEACECMIAGIDLLVDKHNQTMVIELNATPFLHAQGVHPKVNEQEVFKQVYLRLRVMNYLNDRNNKASTNLPDYGTSPEPSKV